MLKEIAVILAPSPGLSPLQKSPNYYSVHSNHVSIFSFSTPPRFELLPFSSINLLEVFLTNSYQKEEVTPKDTLVFLGQIFTGQRKSIVSKVKTLCLKTGNACGPLISLRNQVLYPVFLFKAFLNCW